MQSFEGWLREPEIYVDFHKRFNKNDRIKITPWKLEGRSYNRESVQLIPLRAPGIIRKAIGAQQGPAQHGILQANWHTCTLCTST